MTNSINWQDAEKEKPSNKGWLLFKAVTPTGQYGFTTGNYERGKFIFDDYTYPEYDYTVTHFAEINEP